VGSAVCWEARDLDGLWDRLESDGWEMEGRGAHDGTLAPMPFDPRGSPQTVRAHPYARFPEIKTHCLLMRVRRQGPDFFHHTLEDRGRVAGQGKTMRAVANY
jgi:hypothetical protein